MQLVKKIKNNKLIIFNTTIIYHSAGFLRKKFKKINKKMH